MTTPTSTDILALLNQLDASVADDLETQWLDFKPWNNARDDMKIAVEYAVCFANADGGVVVFGVADHTRGRTAAVHGASGYNLDTWRRGIFDATRPNLTVELEELPAQLIGAGVRQRRPSQISRPYSGIVFSCIRNRKRYNVTWL